YNERRRLLGEAVNQFGWDGRWFWRASRDDGRLVGSAHSGEERIFLNPQTWAVISGITDDTRQQTAVREALKRLECDNGMQLFSPAYKTPDETIGYLSRYAPGVRENGGVYTHAASWTIWAAAELNDGKMAYRIYRKLNPVLNGQNPERYQAEPYVTPGNIDGRESAKYGRGGWSWYTGSAAWYFRVTIDFLLGIRAGYDGLHVQPMYPQEWESVSVKRFFRGVSYRITMENDNTLTAGQVVIYVDNEKTDGNIIPPVKGRKKVNVRVARGTKRK
ncbi:MAG: glycosyl transferase family 36, partial [Alphaproteobacteria bacterium]|nr:glycosyl transferase family 36 [Alphaproteobacteria bacterium]